MLVCMARVTLTLDPATVAWIRRRAAVEGVSLAGVCRQLLQEAISRREGLVRDKKLAADYVAGRRDARALLAELEGSALELWTALDGRRPRRGARRP